MIVGKYGQEDGGRHTKGVRQRNGVGMWKAIKNRWEVSKIKLSSRLALGT